MATYIKFLEDMAASEDIKTFWDSRVSPNDRKPAAAAIKQFIEQHGQFVPRTITMEAKWLDCYYRFPTMSLSKESPLRNSNNLVKLYKFFFSPITVVEVYDYE